MCSAGGRTVTVRLSQLTPLPRVPMRSHDVAHVDALRHKELGRPFAHLPDHVFVASQPRESDFADAGIGIAHQLRIFGGARRAVLRAPRVHMASGVELINHEGHVKIKQRLGCCDLRDWRRIDGGDKRRHG